MCDGCKRSNDVIVCHRIWSILWSIVQVCSLTIEYQVFQSMPSTSISEQFESILLTIPLQISILLPWNGGHQGMEWILCRVVESFCSPTNNIVPHISWHDPPYHKTMKKYESSQSMEAFQFHPRKFWIQTCFCNCQQYPCLFHVVFEYIPGTRSRKDVGYPKSTSLLRHSTWDQGFVSFQPIWCHPHTQRRIILTLTDLDAETCVRRGPGYPWEHMHPSLWLPWPFQCLTRLRLCWLWSIYSCQRLW